MVLHFRVQPVVGQQQCSQRCCSAKWLVMSARLRPVNRKCCFAHRAESGWGPWEYVARKCVCVCVGSVYFLSDTLCFYVVVFFNFMISSFVLAYI